MASLVPFILMIFVVVCGRLVEANEQVRLKVTPGECYEMVRLATAGDRVDMVELLVHQGCSVNRLPGSTSMENTPLHIAVVNGNLDMVKKLVNYGADVNARAHQAAELDKKKCAACKYLLIHD
ncbi:hypothetical protein JTE90_027664 [Oedothorax gibbosus]|uniref:Uncharacterized protein n=1 Tax=Oedothorax gibbosus TaxID=931172 RepID=A0AAV6UNH1_9ARAC|nr:hypothetical protein JTE90_027664 [Oedothorax gibbosus]